MSAPSAELPYAGVVTPHEAHALREAGEAHIVDVRTPDEWRLVGHVPGAPLIAWPRNGGRDELQAFVAAFRERFHAAEKLLLLCRSGARSHAAAELLAAVGFSNVYNVLEGFEGDRGAGLNGWRAAGLPWERP